MPALRDSPALRASESHLGKGQVACATTWVASAPEASVNLLILAPPPGRCSIFPDLSFVTFDGSHAALFKEAIYILTQSPKEMVTVHVLDCKSANLVTVPGCICCWGLGI